MTQEAKRESVNWRETRRIETAKRQRISYRFGLIAYLRIAVILGTFRNCQSGLWRATTDSA